MLLEVKIRGNFKGRISWVVESASVNEENDNIDKMARDCCKLVSPQSKKPTFSEINWFFRRKTHVFCRNLSFLEKLTLSEEKLTLSDKSIFFG